MTDDNIVVCPWLRSVRVSGHLYGQPSGVRLARIADIALTM